MREAFALLGRGTSGGDDPWLQLVGQRGALRGIAATEGGDALFAGAAARVLYNGIVVAAVIPLRSLFYTGLRDALILDGIFEFDA